MSKLQFKFNYKDGRVIITKPNGDDLTISWPIEVTPIIKEYIPTGEEVFIDLCNWLWEKGDEQQDRQVQFGWVSELFKMRYDIFLISDLLESHWTTNVDPGELGAVQGFLDRWRKECSEALDKALTRLAEK